MTFSAVANLTEVVELAEFRCGNTEVDEWLRRDAMRNERKRYSRTFVTFDDAERLAGFFSLSAYSVDRAQAGSLGKGAPNPVPAILLGKLAVHERHHGRGVGASLLQDAIVKALRAASVAAISLMVVHAADDAAAAFYRRFDFRPLRDEALTLLAPIDRLAASVAAD